MEKCALKRDCSAFEIKPGLKLTDLPRFPLEESAQMTRDERFTSVSVYLAKVVDHLQGVEDEPIVTPVRRNHDGSGSCRVSQNLKGEDVLPLIQEGDSTHPTGPERTRQEVRPHKMVGRKD